MAQLEKHYQVTLGRKMLQGLLAEITDGEKKIVLCEPQTYMNASGECVAKLLRWYHAEKDHLMVIYDDIDLPPGKVRVRRNGGPGTHNGMRSIAEQLGDTDFPRIRKRRRRWTPPLPGRRKPQWHGWSMGSMKPCGSETRAEAPFGENPAGEEHARNTAGNMVLMPDPGFRK